MPAWPGPVGARKPAPQIFIEVSFQVVSQCFPETMDAFSHPWKVAEFFDDRLVELLHKSELMPQEVKVFARKIVDDVSLGFVIFFGAKVKEKIFLSSENNLIKNLIV